MRNKCPNQPKQIVISDKLPQVCKQLVLWYRRITFLDIEMRRIPVFLKKSMKPLRSPYLSFSLNASALVITKSDKRRFKAKSRNVVIKLLPDIFYRYLAQFSVASIYACVSDYRRQIQIMTFQVMRHMFSHYINCSVCSDYPLNICSIIIVGIPVCQTAPNRTFYKFFV